MNKPDVPVVERGAVARSSGGLRLTFLVVTLNHPYSGALITATLIALEDQEPAGYLKWAVEGGGKIYDLWTRPDRRRRGVASLLWTVAGEVAAEHGWPMPQHSGQRTEAGEAWARSMGGTLPALDERTDYAEYRRTPQA